MLDIAIHISINSADYRAESHDGAAILFIQADRSIVVKADASVASPLPEPGKLLAIRAKDKGPIHYGGQTNVRQKDLGMIRNRYILQALGRPPYEIVRSPKLDNFLWLHFQHHHGSRFNSPWSMLRTARLNAFTPAALDSGVKP